MPKMKNTLLTFIAWGSAVLSTSAQGLDSSTATAIKSHFSSILEGKNEKYVSDIKIPYSDIATYRSSVWDQWKDANDGYSEIKLPTLPTRYDGQLRIPAVWEIPADLEPQASLKYAWGRLGSSTDACPLIIFLHGSGAKETEWELAKTLAPSFDSKPAIYFIPQFPNEELNGVNYRRWWQKGKQWVWEKIIRQVNLRDEIDINKVYFIGISEGAYGSQRLGTYYADYLAGIAPMAGGEPLNNAPCENLRHVAVHFRTGSNDNGFYRSTLTQACGDSLDLLQQQYPDGYVHDVKTVAGADHTLPKYGEAFPWLVQQTRTTNPKHINWEDYTMDGNWRKGFYNIEVTRRSFPINCNRTYYQMDIDGNNINMQVRGLYYETTNDYNNPYGDDLVLNFNRHYATATSGEIKVYLNNDLVDLSKPVTLTVNGKKVFNGKLQPNLADMVNSTALFYDKERVYPTHIDVNLDNMTADGPTSGIDSLTADDADENAPIEYYNLQGIRIEKPTEKGIYIRRQGSKATKIAIH